MLVRPEMIAAAHKTTILANPCDAIDLLMKREPVLASWVEHQLLVITGKMGLCGARRKVIADSHDEFLSTLTIALDALQAAYLTEWRKTIKGTPLSATLGVGEPQGDDPFSTEEPDNENS